MTIPIERKRRSVALTPEEFKAFKKHMNSFHTKVDAEIAFGLKRQILAMVAIKGSGSSETVTQIRKMLGEWATD